MAGRMYSAAPAKAISLQYIATYKDGLLLGAQRKDNDYSKPLTMVNVDPRDGSTQPLFEMSSSDDYGIEYDAETDTIYYLSSGELYASIALGKPEVRSYLPLSNTWNGSPTALLPGGLYVVSSDNKTIVRNTDPAYKQGGALRINGLYYDMVANKFQEEYPDVPLVMTPDYYPTSEAYTSNMTSDAACDLYVLDLTGDIAETLAAKGYLGDLSTSETLRDAIAKMYPDISDALLRDGKLIAFPQRYEAHTYGYAPKTFEKVGLTEQDVPKTFAQLMQFIDRWEQELSAQFPEITLFNDQEDMVFKNTLFHEIMSTYVSQLRKNNQPIEFDTPVFKSLLEQLNKTDFSGFKQPDPDEEEGGGTVIVSTRGDEDFVPTALFTQYSTVTLNDYILNDGYETMPLSLSDDEPASIRGWLNAFVLNPNSKNIEQAMQFLEYYVNNMSGANKTNLMPDLKEKVESPYYQMQMDELVIRKNEAEDALAKAKGTS
ncbi:ABC transporter substrate-binding protein, partial [Eubacteriales bacterium OttesenSCG-928-N13]|nr:ABC transporter substrate-binding protein [Eubacteriales bacterium OttesenSCG-928-N13]